MGQHRINSVRNSTAHTARLVMCPDCRADMELWGERGAEYWSRLYVEARQAGNARGQEANRLRAILRSQCDDEREFLALLGDCSAEDWPDL